MLYTKEIAKISYEDVIAFCEQKNQEGFVLDYKEEVSKGLAKTIAAFANTWGGIILIGVKDEDSRPKEPFEGMDYAEGLEEQITQIILSQITPPVFPEIQVCANKEKTKAFVIIRVPQSNLTPHAIQNNTAVYIRTNNISNPYSSEIPLSLEKIEWLKERRKKSEELKNSFYKDAEKLLKKTAKNIELKDFPLIKFSATPLYPDKILAEPRELFMKTTRENPLMANGYGGAEMPPLRHLRDEIKAIPNGIIAYGFKHGFTMNQFGFIQIFQTLGYAIHAGNLAFFQIMMNIDLFLELILKTYKELSYWGLIEIKFDIEEIIDGLTIIGERGELQPKMTANPLISSINRHYVFSVKEMEESRVEVAKKIISEIAWDFGLINLDENIVEYSLKGAKRI